MNNFTTTELEVVQRWLRAEEKYLYDSRMRIECGDDFAMTNNKWPRVQELKVEEVAVKQQQKRAFEQLTIAQKFEEKINETSSSE